MTERPDDMPGPLLRFIANRLPMVSATWRAGASEAELAGLEATVGHPLPPAARTLWGLHDGQALGDNLGLGLVFGLVMLPVAAIGREWRSAMDALSGMAPGVNEGVIWPDPSNRIRNLHLSPGWVPFCDDAAGGYVGFDFDPGPRGRYGQIISMGGREQPKRVIAPDFGAFLQWMLGQFEAGNWTLEEAEPGEAESLWLLLRDPPNSHFLDAVRTIFRP